MSGHVGRGAPSCYNGHRMVITIDGPAGVGKSNVSQGLAERLGFSFLNTGAMYRAVGMIALEHDSTLGNLPSIMNVVRHIQISFDWNKMPPEILVGGWKPGRRLSTPEVAEAASCVAKEPEVRSVLVEQQRAVYAQRGDLVTEGRDQGTIVFPAAELKIFLTAPVEVRAKRRWDQYIHSGHVREFDECVREIEERDHRDRNRPVAPMVPALGARELDTATLTKDQVIDQLYTWAIDAGAIPRHRVDISVSPPAPFSAGGANRPPFDEAGRRQTPVGSP